MDWPKLLRYIGRLDCLRFGRTPIGRTLSPPLLSVAKTPSEINILRKPSVELSHTARQCVPRADATLSRLVGPWGAMWTAIFSGC